MRQDNGRHHKQAGENLGSVGYVPRTFPMIMSVVMVTMAVAAVASAVAMLMCVGGGRRMVVLMGVLCHTSEILVFF